MRILKLMTLAVSLLSLAACASSPHSSDPAADQAALHAGTTSWMKAYNAGDVDRIIALYAKDAVVSPPHAPTVTGHAAIRSYLTADIAGAKAAGVTLVDGKSDAGVSGDLGWHSGSFKVTDKSGATVDTGHYMEICNRIDGKWLITRDIWNSDRPIEPNR